MPWYTLFSLFLVAIFCCSCGIVHQWVGGEDEENEEDKKEMEEMTMAKIQNLLDVGFDRISQVLQQSNLAPQAVELPDLESQVVSSGPKRVDQDQLISSGDSTGTEASSSSSTGRPHRRA